MKTITGPLGRVVFALTLTLAGVADDARADDQLDFKVSGSVTPSCTLASQRLQIDLGTVTFAELGGDDAVSPWRGGSFIGLDCVGATRASVTLRGRAYGPNPRYLATGGGASGVAIELRTGGGDPVLPDGRTPVAFAWGEGEARLAFEARYVRVGRLAAGEAGATAIIEISWE